MKGSVAIWYEPLDESETSPPEVELHFNLWRDLVVRGSNYLDVGILFKAPTDGKGVSTTLANTAESFCLFLPAPLSKTQVVDLSRLMEHGSTLNAVFNDVVTVTHRHDLSFDTAIGKKPHLTFHKLDLDHDIEIQPIETALGELGTLFIFRRSFCARCSDKQRDQYLRLRFVLNGLARDLFTSDSRPSDWFLVSSFARTELTEFRLNERRSFPVAIAERARAFFRIQTVHYFLMRDLKFELVSAHTDFRKLRRLEEDLWRHYLLGTPPGLDPGWPVRRAMARGSAKRMIIYHWRVQGEDDKPIDDFVALASFRVPIPNLVIYAVVIGFLGGVGNAFYGVSLTILQTLGLSQSAEGQSPILTNLAAAVLLLLLALIAPHLLIWAWGRIVWSWDGLLELHSKFRNWRRQ